MSDVAFVVLIGLPAAGKTRLCAALQAECSISGIAVNVVHVCYDSLLPRQMQLAEGDDSKWHKARQTVIELIDSLLDRHRTGFVAAMPASHDQSAELPEQRWQQMRAAFESALPSGDAPSRACAVLIDDNMFYRSMRYSFAQLARKYSCGFCEVLVDCAVEVALQRNALRTVEHRVAEQVIVQMGQKLEAPRAELHSWERLSLVYQHDDSVGRVIELINEALEAPLVPLMSSDTRAKKELSRQATLDSSEHQLDIEVRRAISECVRRVPADERTTIGKRLAASKAVLISEIKEGRISLSDRETLIVDMLSFASK